MVVYSTLLSYGLAFIHVSLPQLPQHVVCPHAEVVVETVGSKSDYYFLT